MAERAIVAALHGGGLAPVAAWGRIEGEQLFLTGRVLDPGGKQKLEAAMSWQTTLNRSANAWPMSCYNRAGRRS